MKSTGTVNTRKPSLAPSYHSSRKGRNVSFTFTLINVTLHCQSATPDRKELQRLSTLRVHDFDVLYTVICSITFGQAPKTCNAAKFYNTQKRVIA